MTQPTIGNASLVFVAEDLATSLADLVKRLPPAQSAEAGPKSKVEVAVPAARESLVLEPMRTVAMREILEVADQGEVRVFLPLNPQRIAFGPIAVEIVAGTEVVVDLVVRPGGLIARDRESTRVDLVPPIRLPLGTSLKGAYLEPDGTLKVDITNFPDLNLSRLALRGLRIPATLDEVLSMVFDREAKGEPKETSDEKKPGPVDFAALRVEARRVRARRRRVEVGAQSFLLLGPGTLLDIDYGPGELGIRGRVEVLDSLVMGKGFAFERIAGTAEVAWTLALGESQATRLTVEKGHLSLGGGRVELDDGTHVALGLVDLEGVRVSIDRTKEGALDWWVESEQAKGKLEGGLVRGSLSVNESTAKVAVEIEPVAVAGSLRVGTKALSIAAKISEGRIRTRAVTLDLGLGELGVEELVAGVRGELRLDRESGLAFEGELEATGAVASGTFGAGLLTMKLAPGTTAALRIVRLSGDAKALRTLEGSGSLSLVLQGGSFPVGEGGSLRFVEGATGRVTLETFALARSQAWPSVRASLSLAAATQPTVLDPLLVLPGARATVEVPELVLDGSGKLRIPRVALELRT